MHNVTASLIVPFRISADMDRSAMLDALVLGLPDREDLEVLLVDDGSTLTYLPPTSAHTRLRLLRLPQGRQFAGQARNLAIDLASGDWLIFADSDDLLDCDGLESLLSGMTKGDWDGFDLLVPYALSFRDDNPSRSGRRHRFCNRRVARVRRSGDLAGLVRLPACWMRVVRRSFVKTAGVRFGSTPMAEDIDFAVDLGLAHPRAELLDFVLPVIREGNDSLSRRLDASACALVLSVKLAANARLRAGGLGRWQYPLLLDLLALMRCAPVTGGRWLLRLLTSGGRLFPSVADLREAFQERLRKDPVPMRAVILNQSGRDRP